MITIDRATQKDILEFADNIRPMDAEEVEVVSGRPFREQMYYLMKNLKHVKVIRCDGVLLGIGGWYRKMLDWGIYSQGVIGWMLLTNAVKEHSIEFLRWSKELVKTLLKSYPSITNTLYIKNKLHIKYLDFLGASFYPDIFRKDILHFIIERR